MRILFLLLTGLYALSAAAQITAEAAYPPVSDADGNALSLAWAGGMNAPQPQVCDLNGDGRGDLLLFDRASDHLTALLGDGSGNYRVGDRALLAGFPDNINSWIILRDFNGDGVQDIFTYALELDGVRVFRGRRSADGRLTFEPLRTDPNLAVLYYPLDNGGRGNIFVSNIDYPSVDDVDGDGDLDFLTFNVAGGYVEWFRNVTAEQGLSDTLAYVLEDACWGGFFESGIEVSLDLAAAPGECVSFLPDGEEEEAGPTIDFRHSGSTVLNLDYDGNGLTDIMLGDVSFVRVVLGLNYGSADQAWIGEQDANWNSDGEELILPSFPGMYHLDADQDGRRDLLAAPHQTLNAEDVNSLWWYRNEGTAEAPDFVFRDSQFLARDMIDVGTGSAPTFFDYDADGDLDLLVGNDENYSRSNFINSFVAVYENVTAPGEAPAFRLAETDYLNLTRFRNTAWNFAPTFGDLDGDGDQDLIVGTNTGKLFYGENTAGPGAAPEFPVLTFNWMDLDAGQFAKPHIADLDRDGLPDLLVGGFDGRIRFYRNVGTATAPRFEADLGIAGNQLQLGGIDARVSTSTGHPTPWVLQNEEQSLIVTGTRDGRIEAYRLPAGADYTGDYELVTEFLGEVEVGRFSHPAFADLDEDGELDMVVGNRRGGLTYFITNLTGGGTVGLRDVADAVDLRVFPNPTHNRVTVTVGDGAQVQGLHLFSLLGRSVAQSADSDELSVADLPTGVYLLRVRLADGRTASRRLVVR